MNSDPLTRVVFYQVRDNASKLKRIVETAQSHFEKKEPFLILVEDERSQQFVDELLWKLPESSFLPHTAADAPTSESILITKSKKNLNNAKIAFNLCSTPLLIEGPFRIIYEFEDLTSPNKKNLSSLRFDAYKQARFLIEARQ
ncbi:MAG TPA: DNA polymerase III subunit chi [Chlamydiales bacterium]|nr:DNA polymerase III subunit chi [Chlamydiales bacterium]